MNVKRSQRSLNRFATIACEAFLVLAFALSAGTVSGETLLLRNATVHTVVGKTFSPGDVLIENGKIRSVDEKITERADRTIDLSGQHLYPGLIALNTALGLSEISGVRATRDTTEVGEFVPDVQSWIALNPDSELIPVARNNGVTHIQPAPQGGIVAGQSALVVLDGWTTEEMVYKKAVALHVYWPDMSVDSTPKNEARDKSKWKSPEDQAKERQLKLKEIDDFFDDAAAYDKAREAGGSSDPGLNPSWEAMRAFVCGKLPIMIHANEVRQIKAAVKWAEARNYSVIIVGGRDSWQVAQMLSSKNIPVLYECVFELPARDSDSYDVYFSAPAKLHQAGVKLALGMGATTFDAAFIRNLPYSASQAVAFGLPCDEAIKSMTLVPAQLLGLDDRLGSIEPGKDATLFAVNGDILDLRANVQHLWIGGREISLESRHTRLYERYRSRPKKN